VNETVYILALQSTPGIGNVLLKQLISYCGSAEEVFNSSTGKLKKVPGIGNKLAGITSDSHTKLANAKDLIDRTQKLNGQIIPYTSNEYPSRLKEINDCPAVLFINGTWNSQNQKVVSIVGTRSATPYGKQVVEEVMEGIAPYNPLVVSGLAYGIDIHAHKTALKNNLQTVGVMGSGLDIIYPKLHTKIAAQMMSSGGLVTEHPLGTKPDAPHFPMRNRIIAGMSDAVIVIEAAEKGGALITAELANGYGRDVLAVPGNLHSSYSEGCNKLIRNHKAHILTNPDDIAYLLNWPDSKQSAEPKDISGLNGDEQIILTTLLSSQKGLQIDELSISTKIGLPQLAGLLLQLEFDDWIVSLPGKIYKIK